MFTQAQLKDILKKGKLLDDKELEKYAEEAKAQNTSLENHLIGKKIVSEDLLYSSAAIFFNIPFINLKGHFIRKDVLFLIPEPIANTHKFIAFDKEGDILKVATLEPKDLQTIEFLKKKVDSEIQVHLTTPSAFQDATKQYHKGLKAEFKELSEEKPEEKGLKQLSEELPIVKIVDTLLEYAIIEGASDIHIEPAEKEVNVRYRIDGILKNVMTLPKTAKAGVIARIKVLSNLKIDEHRLPQDGRFKIQTPEHRVSFRVSVIPVINGEKIVMRLLRESSQILTLEQLGFQSDPLEIIKRNIKKPHGMILVTGPTGSGKTTTLYTILNLLNSPGVNIITIEDPIEYQMPGINQSQVSPKIGFTFASGLRAFLRQDPDIIMVGEIRDKETAEIAAHAALTGHLVLSTLHTNDAPSTLPRLLEMGIPSFLVAGTTNIIIAQRLVRKICPSCIESYNLDKKSVKELEKQFDVKEIMNGLTRTKAITKIDQSLESLLFYHGKGCKQCNQQGYKGRIGIYEIMEITNEVAKLILKNPSKQELKDAATKQGMLTIIQDGFVKAKNGITTIEEIMRVTKE